MRFPDFDLPTADGPRLDNAALAGRPWFAYMARHPGCFVCQARLADALDRRDAVRALGGDLVVFFNSPVEYTRTWTAHAKEQGRIPGDLTVAIDPDAALYEAVGTVRGRVLHDVRHTLGSMWRSRAHAGRWRLTRADMLRMGADVGVRDDGTVAFRHVCRDPEDRADPLTVVTALTTAAPAVAP